MNGSAERRHAPAQFGLNVGSGFEKSKPAVAPKADAKVLAFPVRPEAEAVVASPRRRKDAVAAVQDMLHGEMNVETLREQTLHELEVVSETLESADTSPQNKRRATQEKAEIEARLVAIEERRKPAFAYHDARRRYEMAVEALTQEKETHENQMGTFAEEEWQEEYRAQHAANNEHLIEQVWFWRGQTEAQGRRLAEEQVEHDIRALDLDAYRRGLETKYRILAEHENEYDDAAPELLEMAFLQQKIKLFAERMEDPKLQRRLHVERQRQTLARSAERTLHAISRAEAIHKSLNWLNPFHWRRIIDVDEHLAQLRHELEHTQMRSKLLTTAPAQEEMTGPMWPKPKTHAKEIIV